jgi:rhombotail lipoprotein
MRKPLLLLMIATVTLSGCTILDHALCGFGCSQRSTSSSSLVVFLYPHGELPPADDAIPELKLPLRVGLTFLPAAGNAPGLDAAARAGLLENVRQRFLSREFVAEIVVIPDYYLSGRGFDSLGGLQRLYDLDLLALVSHDQLTHSDENALSLTYLTIVGAYLVPASRHEVTTLVDLAVVDPATRSLLLRAGGSDSQSRTTTLIDKAVTSRSSQQRSFEAAGAQMIEHFDVALKQFEENVRSGKARVRVSKRQSIARGAGGGGAVDGILLVAALGLAAARSRRRRIEGEARDA